MAKMSCWTTLVQPRSFGPVRRHHHRTPTGNVCQTGAALSIQGLQMGWHKSRGSAIKLEGCQDPWWVIRQPLQDLHRLKNPSHGTPLLGNSCSPRVKESDWDARGFARLHNYVSHQHLVLLHKTLHGASWGLSVEAGKPEGPHSNKHLGLRAQAKARYLFIKQGYHLAII